MTAFNEERLARLIEYRVFRAVPLQKRAMRILAAPTVDRDKAARHRSITQ